MCGNQSVRIGGDHLPRPSQVASRICRQDASAISGCSSLPLKLALRSVNGLRVSRSAITRRKPSSTSALTVVCSFAANRAACPKADFEISTLVFKSLYVSSLTSEYQEPCANTATVRSLLKAARRPASGPASRSIAPRLEGTRGRRDCRFRIGPRLCARP